MPFQQGEMLNNRYRIVKLLGQGGFGAVYRAWDTNLSRPCAVQENLDASPEAHRQFGREATVLARVKAVRFFEVEVAVAGNWQRAWCTAICRAALLAVQKEVFP